jgi:hypothetical protein
VKYTVDGVLVPTKQCPKELLQDIMIYFQDRNEDEFYQEDAKTAKMIKEISFDSIGLDLAPNVLSNDLSNDLSNTLSGSPDLVYSRTDSPIIMTGSPLSIEIPVETTTHDKEEAFVCPPCPRGNKKSLLELHRASMDNNDNDSDNDLIDIDDVTPPMLPWAWFAVWDKFIGNR